MSILKALQKKQAEETSRPEAPANVVPFEKTSKRAASAGKSPEAFLDENFKIGSPNSAFNEQSDSFIGKALPDLEAGITAGATLNAGGLTRTPERRPLDFIKWDVDRERVEPRLIAITQPHSTYCEEYRSLRTHILHRTQRQKLQSIVVASVSPCEDQSNRARGETFTAHCSGSER